MLNEETNILSERNNNPISTKSGKSEVTQKSAKTKFFFLASSVNPEIQKRFLGIWIPILRQILGLLAFREKSQIHFILNSLIENSNVNDKVSIIEDIFGVYDLERKKD